MPNRNKIASDELLPNQCHHSPQTVTVTAVNDSAVEGDHVSIVIHQVATSAAEVTTATVDDVVGANHR
ncbi:MAG: hypothetical protein R3C28_13000 [Pirellulaceae bacterium]